MIVVNGNTSNTVIFNGSPTTGILNGSVIWGTSAPVYTYTASGTLSASKMRLGIYNKTYNTVPLHLKVDEMSPEISATWINTAGYLQPPTGTFFESGSELYLSAGFSAYSNRYGEAVCMTGLLGVNSANKSGYVSDPYILNGGFSSTYGSGSFPNITASGTFDFNNRYANGPYYTGNRSGMYINGLMKYTGNSTTASANITSTYWSGTFKYRGE